MEKALVCKVRYEGFVQGVGFRYSTQKLVSQFPVVGYVKNLPDGSVELLLQGEREEIEKALSSVRNYWQKNISGESLQWIATNYGDTISSHFEIR